jgi:hypothetical protein
MNIRNFLSFIVITAFTLLGAVKIAPTFAYADVPNAVGSNGVDITTLTSDGSNTSDSGAILPNTQGTTTSDSGAILPNTEGTTTSDSGAILPNTQGSNDDESTTIAPTAYSITTSIIGDENSGTITCNGATCSSYPSGTVVTLAAAANTGYTFSGWSDSTGFTPACTGTGTCSITLTANSSVSATFTANTQETTDICPNITEVQTSIPSGMILDSSGNCVAQNNGSSGGSPAVVSLASFSSGGSSVTPLVTLATTTAPATTPILTCPLITTYMKFGGINNPTDVAKLQAFLKNSQGLNVTVNGIFDQQMENAVRAFQSKYMSQIMGPWGANQSSGYVYITTLKKVNEIACNTPLTLSAADLAIINAYKNSQVVGTNAGQTAPGTIVVPGTLNIPGTTNTGTTPLTPIIGQNGTSSNANVAAVGSFAGTWNNFWGSVWKGITKIF